MIRFNVIAFTHTGIGLEELGHFHLDEATVADQMNKLKTALGITEIMYLSTCNRVEFVLTIENPVDENFVNQFVSTLKPDWTEDHVANISKKARFWNGINAVNHLIEVASSLDSMVLGEREIITQVRNAYDYAKQNGLSGDTIRVVIRQTIETAKKVYTETAIAEKSVSVVSLAYQCLAEKNIPTSARILVIGSGVTNQNMCKFLVKHGYTNYTVYNRTLQRAQLLADQIGGIARPLDELDTHTEGFDILITCTGANEPVVTPTIYAGLLAGENPANKTIIDLAIPTDVCETVHNHYETNYISVASVKQISERNLLERKRELLKARHIIYESLEAFKEIFEMRQMELRMQEIPKRVKEIRSAAVNEVFSKEMQQLDDESKVVLEKILNYMEKKYVSVPMLMAKEIITKK